jgi:hypothetical protein
MYLRSNRSLFTRFLPTLDLLSACPTPALHLPCTCVASAAWPLPAGFVLLSCSALLSTCSGSAPGLPCTPCNCSIHALHLICACSAPSLCQRWSCSVGAPWHQLCASHCLLCAFFAPAVCLLCTCSVPALSPLCPALHLLPNENVFPFRPAVP